MAEIEQLIEEYNAVEAEQRERLIRLYGLIDARTGYRRVGFSDFTWSNCWGWPAETYEEALRKFVAPLVREIVSADLGGEPVE